MGETDNRLGTLLIKNKAVNYQQLTQALEFQAKLNDKNKMPLGEVLIQFGFVTRSSIVEVLKEQEAIKKEQEREKQLAEEAKNNKSQAFTFKPSFNRVKKDEKPLPPPPPPVMDVNLASKTGPKISNNIYSDRSKHKPIGEIMLEKEYINRSQLSHALEYQSTLPSINYKPIGEVLIDLKYITREQLSSALNIQPPINNSLGEILTQLGIIDATQLSIVLMQQHSVGGKNVMIGELLMQHGFITKEQLDLALEEQKKRTR